METKGQVILQHLYNNQNDGLNKKGPLLVVVYVDKPDSESGEKLFNFKFIGSGTVTKEENLMLVRHLHKSTDKTLRLIGDFISSVVFG